MAFEFKLPEIGEGVSEGEIVKWLVNEGDTIREDQPIVEIMTDKATMEIASPTSGKVQKRMAGEGQMIQVGKTLAVIDETGAKASKPTSTPEAKPTQTAAAVQAAPVMAAPTPANNTKVLASPATRKMAREMGVDLTRVAGSGPVGRVLMDDLTKTPGLASRPTTSSNYQPRTTTASGGEERIPLRGIRKKIAEHMTKSRHTAMHFTQVDEVDFTALTDLKDAAREKYEPRGVKITYLPFITRALCQTLKEFPNMNGSLDDEKQEIIIKHYYNIGIAAQTDTGLVVPVVKNADQKTIVELAQEIASLADKAKTGKLAATDMQGGTFTITSTGNSGGLFATPIINHPELGIIAINRIQDSAVVRDGQIVIRKMGHLSLSLDHRIIDGAVGASFLKSMKNKLENPGLMFLEE